MTAPPRRVRFANPGLDRWHRESWEAWWADPPDPWSGSIRRARARERYEADLRAVGLTPEQDERWHREFFTAPIDVEARERDP